MPLEQQNFVYVDIHMNRLTLWTAAGKAGPSLCRNEWQLTVTTICVCLNYLMYTQFGYLYAYHKNLGPGTLLVHDKHYPLKESAYIERLDVFCQRVWGLELKHAHARAHTHVKFLVLEMGEAV